MKAEPMINPLRSYWSRLNEERSETPEVISFRTTRRAVGWLGILLPFLLLAGAWLGDCRTLQPSISHYYFTSVREVFVGVLCAVSLFLFTYKGHSLLDGVAANIAAIFSLGVALFPTNYLRLFPCQAPTVSVIAGDFNDELHLASAALFFGTLAFMSLYLFTKSKHPREQWTQRKKKRNTLYKVCGWLIVFCILMIGSSGSVFKVKETSTFTFWFEALALLAFGVSWLTKGEQLLRDRSIAQMGTG
jgi:cytochrome bd-type quinol oxidase subunit 2